MEKKCVDCLLNLIWAKFFKITAWKAAEGQDLQISRKKSTKKNENLNKMTCTILKGNLEKFLKIQENLNFLQKIENLKALQAEFQAILSNLSF